MSKMKVPGFLSRRAKANPTKKDKQVKKAAETEEREDLTESQDVVLDAPLPARERKRAGQDFVRPGQPRAKSSRAKSVYDMPFGTTEKGPTFSSLPERRNTKRKALSEAISVIVRVRPYLPGELQAGNMRCVVQVKGDVVCVSEPTQHSFAFDQVYPGGTTQHQIYEEGAKLIVDQSLDGFNGTIFAYGQTGSGKSHTMMGEIEDPDMCGIVPRCVEQIFEYAGTGGASDFDELNVTMSYLEIYNEEVRDLLGSDPKEKLEIREESNSFFVPRLLKKKVRNRDHALAMIMEGTETRTVSANDMHAGSSRSHSMITFYIEKKAQIAGQMQTIASKLNLVDLAGSEKYQVSTEKAGKESLNINQSLSCLANVISALTTGKKAQHIPYRESKLTRLLKESLGGNSKTLMISNMHPSYRCAKETLSTLRYASRAKRIKNAAKINSDADERVEALYDEISRLKDLLNKKDKFAKHVLGLVHELVLIEQSAIQDEEEDWETTSINHMYKLGRAARIGDEFVETFREDVSSIKEMCEGGGIAGERAETRADDLAEEMSAAKERVAQLESNLRARANSRFLREEELANKLKGLEDDADTKDGLLRELLEMEREPPIIEGELQKKSGGLIRRWQKRHCALTAKMLAYWKDKKKDKLHFASIPLGELKDSSVVRGDEQGTPLITIHTDERSFFFMATDDEHADLWVSSIKAAIAQYHATYSSGS